MPVTAVAREMAVRDSAFCMNSPTPVANLMMGRAVIVLDERHEILPGPSFQETDHEDEPTRGAGLSLIHI